MSSVSPGLHSLNSDLQSNLWEEKKGNTLLLFNANPGWSSVHSSKAVAIDSFIFLHEIIPRGRKKSNVLCKNSTSIRACFVILDWGKPEASSQFNHISSAGLPGEGDWVLSGLGMFPLALGAFGVLRLRSPDFPQGISSPAGSEGSRVVRAEEAQIYLHHLRLILTTRSGVLQVGRLRKARIEEAIQKFFQADWVAQDHSPHKW